jgi:hypothetical protein
LTYYYGDFDVCYSAVEAAVFEAVAAVGLLVQQPAVPATIYVILSYHKCINFNVKYRDSKGDIIYMYSYS